MIQKFGMKGRAGTITAHGRGSRRNLFITKMGSTDRMHTHDSDYNTDERYELALKEQQAELEREEMIARQRVNTEITQEGGHKKMIFGRWPAKPVSVIWERADDPKEMMKGMEEYFFKQTQAMNFGDKKSLEEQIHQAVIVDDSMNYRVFNHNLSLLVEEEKKR